MKKSRFFILFFALFLGSLCEAKETTTEPNVVLLEKKGKDNGNKRPKMPQRHSAVECYYQDGVITIEFEIAEGDAVFTVTDVMTGDNASTTFNTAMEFNYFIGSESSTYLLEISTSAGNDYEGYLTID